MFATLISQKAFRISPTWIRNTNTWWAADKLCTGWWWCKNLNFLHKYLLRDFLENHPAFAKAEQFRELILQKKSDEDILQALEDKGDLFDLGQSYSQESVAIFFSVLLKFASKTLTHSFAALTRFLIRKYILTPPHFLLTGITRHCHRWH